MKNIFKLSFLLLAVGSVAISCTEDEEMAPFKPVFFSETFEGIENTGNNQYIAIDGWSNVSLNGGAERWEALYRSDSGQYAQLAAFGTGETNMDTWLITSAIDFEQTENEALIFSYKAGFHNGQAVSVLVSTDYDGSNTAQAINNATWTDLEVVLPDFLTNGYPTSFSLSKVIDLSQFSGNVHVAFRYLGSSAGTSTTYQIDKIKLFENK